MIFIFRKQAFKGTALKLFSAIFLQPQGPLWNAETAKSM
jgi:hypothetical protein